MTFRGIAALAMRGAAWPSATAKETALDRYVAKPIDFALNLGPWRHFMFNAFVTARRK